ncbi:MAG TPA: AbrB/MazE/SpoVT family DNA-binding domain-containing protein [Dissulfurispiraceae bacterium]|nr:AbrB/MazE/SpoVT family DNA-binding domain-containing protein [Dissulfurispiraceae bacterium]
MLVSADSRRRITIPADLGINPGDAIDIEVLEDGRIMLVPVATIPKHQLWAWTKENRAVVEKSLSDTRPSVVVKTGKEADAVAKRWTSEG